MTQKILVCTDGSDYAKTACDYAFFLAGLNKGSVTGIHVLDSRMLEAPMMVDSAGWIGAEPFGEQLQLFREVTEKKGEAVADAFNKYVAEKGADASIEIKMGHPPAVILDEEENFDLVIAGQKGEDAQWIGSMIGSTAERVARHSTKPCMITPEKFVPVTRILAAFDGSEHAREALTKASEMAKANRFELIMLCVADGVEPEENQRIADEGMAIIQSYGCDAEAIVAEGDAEALILDTVAKRECNLLVVGAYGHSRIREMILGSTTTHLIARSDIPVMLFR